MGGLILVIVGFLFAIVFGMKIGVEMTAEYLYDQHRINRSEYGYMCSWNYLTDILKNGIRNRE